MTDTRKAHAHQARSRTQEAERDGDWQALDGLELSVRRTQVDEDDGDHELIQVEHDWRDGRRRLSVLEVGGEARVRECADDLHMAGLKRTISGWHVSRGRWFGACGGYAPSRLPRWVAAQEVGLVKVAWVGEEAGK